MIHQFNLALTKNMAISTVPRFFSGQSSKGKILQMQHALAAKQGRQALLWMDKYNGSHTFDAVGDKKKDTLWE